MVATMAKRVLSAKWIPGQKRLPNPNVSSVTFLISESRPLNRSGLKSIGLGYTSGSCSMYLLAGQFRRRTMIATDTPNIGHNHGSFGEFISLIDVVFGKAVRDP